MTCSWRKHREEALWIKWRSNLKVFLDRRFFKRAFDWFGANDYQFSSFEVMLAVMKGGDGGLCRKDAEEPAPPRTTNLQHCKSLRISTQPHSTKLCPRSLTTVVCTYSALVCIWNLGPQVPLHMGLSIHTCPTVPAGRVKPCSQQAPDSSETLTFHPALPNMGSLSDELTGFYTGLIIFLLIDFHFSPESYLLGHSQLQPQKSCHPAQALGTRSYSVTMSQVPSLLVIHPNPLYLAVVQQVQFSFETNLVNSD